MRVEQVAPLLRQHHQDIPPAVELNGSDETLVAQASQIAFPRVAGLAVVVSKVAALSDPERAHGGHRANLRAAQLILVAAVADVLALETTRQVQRIGEHITRNDVLTVERVVFAVAPVVTIAAVVGARIIEHTSLLEPARCRMRGRSRVQGLAVSAAKLERWPLPTCLQNSGGIRRIAVDSRELAGGSKALGLKLLATEVQHHQQVRCGCS